MGTAHKGNGSYVLTETQYKKLSRIIYDTAGIHLGDNKKELVHARLSKILRKRKIKDFSDYLALLSADTTGDELTLLLDAIATNVTHFFREESHFDFLVQTVRRERFVRRPALVERRVFERRRAVFAGDNVSGASDEFLFRQPVYPCHRYFNEDTEPCDAGCLSYEIGWEYGPEHAEKVFFER